MKNKILIAIDGPAGSGKSSTAKALAKRLGLPFIDTGAMYRAITLKAMREKVAFEDRPGLVKIARSARIELKGKNPLKQQVWLDGRNVSAAVRRPEVTSNVFHIAQEPAIRREMVRKQRAMGKARGGVMEGRDIGTVVFPEADFKFFFVASMSVRARRRREELAAVGTKLSLGKVLLDIARRDRSDYRRKEGPLRRAKDAIRLDTSSLTIDETIDKMLALIRSKSLKAGNLSPKQSD